MRHSLKIIFRLLGSASLSIAIACLFVPSAAAQNKPSSSLPSIGDPESGQLYRRVCSQSPYRLIARNALPAEAPGNSIAAIENAIEQGYYNISLDVSYSSDGIPYAHSSSTLELEDGTKSNTCDFSFSEVSTVQPFVEFADKEFGLPAAAIGVLEDVKALDGELFDDYKIASLGEIFKKFGASANYFLNVIPSRCNNDIAKKLEYLIERNKLENNVWIESNNVGLLSSLRKMNPKLKLVLRTSAKQLSDKKSLKEFRKIGVGGFSLLYDKQIARSVAGLDLEEPLFVVGVGTSTKVVNDLCGNVDYFVAGSNFLADLSRFAYDSFNQHREKIKVARTGSKLSRELEAAGLPKIECGKKTSIHLKKNIFEAIGKQLTEACQS